MSNSILSIDRIASRKYSNSLYRYSRLKYFIRYIIREFQINLFKSTCDTLKPITTLFIRLNIRDLSPSAKFVNLQYRAVLVVVEIPLRLRNW